MAFGKANNAQVNALLEDYSKKKRKIKQRLKEFKAVWREDNKRIFSELCFCICTPQSKAVYCDKSIKVLVAKGILFKGTVAQIRKELKAVRFPNNKSKYIFEARKLFLKNDRFFIKDKIDLKKIVLTRKWFVENVKGIGFKEASHFLRNIGWGEELAILDVHILKNMVRWGIVSERPRTLSEGKYLFLEQELKKFADQIMIPMAELDLLFWSSETGEIFK